jgi:hypothetical protein
MMMIISVAIEGMLGGVRHGRDRLRRKEGCLLRTIFNGEMD